MAISPSGEMAHGHFSLRRNGPWLFLPQEKWPMAITPEQKLRIIAHFCTEEMAHGHFSLRRNCLLYTSPSPRDVEESRMPSSA